MHGLLLVPCALFSTVPFYWTHISRMGFLETTWLPVHVCIDRSVEILFHMVHLRNFYNYIWSGFQWMVRFFTTQTPMGPCKKCWHFGCWVGKEFSSAATRVEHTSQHLATSLWVTLHSKVGILFSQYLLGLLRYVCKMYWCSDYSTSLQENLETLCSITGL